MSISYFINNSVMHSMGGRKLSLGVKKLIIN